MSESRNEITGPVYGAAIQAGSIGAVSLPEPAPVALAGLPGEDVFVGRDAKLAELAAILRPVGTTDELAGTSSPGTVVVSAVAGLAGVGKTALALRAAHRAWDAGWFDGGVLYVDLQGYDRSRQVSPKRALEGFLRALGVPIQHIPSDLPAQQAVYRTHLKTLASQGKAVLLFLDNASTVDQVRPLLPNNHHHRVVVTSRDTLAGTLGARGLELDVLDSGEALELMDAVLRVVNPADDRITTDPDPSSELAQLCGCLPLALRIAAALLAGEPDLPVSELAQRLASATDARRLDLLSDGSRTVRAAFDLSYHQLSAEQARMFCLLSLKPGPSIDTAAAAALTGYTVDDARAVLRQLATAHLIETAATRHSYRFHDLLALYATDCADRDLAATDRDAATDRLLEHYVTNTHAADQHLNSELAAEVRSDRFGSREQALVWLDDQRPNLVAAVMLAFDSHRYEVARDLPTVLHAYLDLRQHWADWISTLTSAVAAARQLGDRPGEGRTLNSLGLAYQAVRRFSEALDCHQHAVDIAQEIGDRRLEGQALGNQGVAYLEMDRPGDAIDCHQQDLAIARQVGDPYAQAHALNNLSAAHLYLRQFDRVLADHDEIVRIFREIGDERAEGGALGNLGLAYLEMDRSEDAVEQLEQAVRLSKKLGDEHVTAKQVNDLGAAYWQVQRFRDAIYCHRQAEESFWNVGDRYGQATALNDLGNAYRAINQTDDAIASHQKAIEAFTEIRDRHGVGQAQTNLGLAHRHAGQRDRARQAFQQAIETFESIDADGEADQVRSWLKDLEQSS